MKILVTGGAGFIGSHVCDALLARGDEVICIDHFDDYYSCKLKERNVSINLDHPRFKLYRVDIVDYEAVKEIFEREQPEKIIHLAAKAGVRSSIQEPLKYEEINVQATINLLELSRKHSLKNFVFASSSSVYGNNHKVPFSELDSTDRPVSPYAATKKAGEILCYTYHSLYGLKVSCLRFFTVYGPRGRPDMAALKFIKLINEDKEIEIYGDGSTQRDYTYVSDIVTGILCALDKCFGYEIFNLGGSHSLDLNHFIFVVETVLGKKAKKKYLPMQQGDVEITFADISKSKKMLGYEPKVSVEEGITKLVQWYKTEGMQN